MQGQHNFDEIRQYVVFDVNEAVKTLSGMDFSLPLGAEDLDTYEITVHGMKSAMLNIDETTLSEYALSLEQAAKDKDFVTIAAKTQGFIDALLEFVANA